MKTQKLFSVMLLVVVLATSAFGQPSKREVVFTMNANEVIYENEYALFQTFNQNRFACVTHDTVTKEFTFVFNGERIRTALGNGNMFDDDWHLYYANPGEAKGYVFTYRENGRWYINYHGVIEGGFDEVYCENPFYERIYTPGKGYDYLYKLAYRWYASRNGENRKIGFVEKMGEDGRQRLNINGVIVGPYGSVSNVTLTENGKYAYCYKENGKHYVNVNGFTVGGPYQHDINGLALARDGKYAFGYSNDEKWYEVYVNVNGSTVGGPYEYDISGLTLAENGEYAYSYRNNGKYYVNVNGFTVGGPYEYDISGLTLIESGKYAYSYRNNEKYYVNVNGSTIGGPYEHDISGLTFTESGKYSYRFYENKRHYINRNGVVAEERSHLVFDNGYGDLDLTSKDDGHSFSSSYEYDYVVIDGRPYGQSPAIEAWYDESKNAFVWSAVENRELVVYEYKLK
ncbi:MAG: hypothetical protein LBF17_01635 [Mediterranea sp.]|nr:hypothetical protein [Mediterranea sp.]